MRTLKEALINKNNIKSVKTTEPNYLIYSFGGDFKKLYFEIKSLNYKYWEVYCINEKEFEKLYLTSAEDYIKKNSFDSATRVWKTYMTKREVLIFLNNEADNDPSMAKFVKIIDNNKEMYRIK